MNKSKKIIIIALALVAVVGIVLFFRKKSLASARSVVTSTKGGPILQPPVSRDVGISFPLKLGDKGVGVRRVQTHITNNPPVPYNRGFLSVDGIFGTETEKAIVKKYNRRSISKELFNSEGM